MASSAVEMREMEEEGAVAVGGRARLTWVAHLLKACVKQHHRPLVPALRPLIPRDAVVLDVGSHAGQFAKLFARMARAGHVYACEPGSYALSILRPAIRFNRLANVTILPVGLGDAEATLTLTMPVKRSGSYGFGLSHLGDDRDDGGLTAEAPVVRETIQVTTVDGLVARRRLERLDFVKADIEGWELRMLLGAKGTLVRLRPALLLEVSRQHLARAGDTPEALFDYLAAGDYHAFRFADDYRTLTPLAHPAEGDIVFVPEERAGVLRKRG